MTEIRLGTKLTLAGLTALGLAVGGCSVRWDGHLPEPDQVRNAYDLEWLGGGPSGHLCLGGTEFDIDPQQHSDYDAATMTVDTANHRFTVTSALGGASLNMRYTVSAPNEWGETTVTTLPADDAARDFMLSKGCELPDSHR